MEPKKQHNGEFPGFSFCHIYPRLRPEEAGKTKTHMDTKKQTEVPIKLSF